MSYFHTRLSVRRPTQYAGQPAKGEVRVVLGGKLVQVNGLPILIPVKTFDGDLRRP